MYTKEEEQEHEQQKKRKMYASKLCVFDFDDTLIDCEMSEFITRIDHDQNGNKIDKITVPNEINQIYYSFNWVFRMNAFFKMLKSQYALTATEVLNQIGLIKISDSMIRLIRLLKEEKNFTLIIISDCNLLFIEEILAANGLKNCFDHIFTNSATVLDSVIKLKPYYEINKLNSQNFP